MREHPMTLTQFNATLADHTPPPALPPTLRALWHDARGDWQRAHEVAQDIDTRDGAWIHAYLHRKEGDEGNAAYWYRRASQPVAHDDLDVEWRRIVESLLDRRA